MSSLVVVAAVVVRSPLEMSCGCRRDYVYLKVFGIICQVLLPRAYQFLPVMWMWW